MCARRLFPPISSFSPPLDGKPACPGRKNCGPTRLDQAQHPARCRQSAPGHGVPREQQRQPRLQWGGGPHKPTTDPLMPSVAVRVVPGGDAAAVVRTEDLLRAARQHWPEAAFCLRLPGARDQLSEDQVPSLCAQGKNILLDRRVFLHLLSSFSPHAAVAAGLLVSLLDLKTLQDLVRERERLAGWPPSYWAFADLSREETRLLHK